jgi:hypothetical protein
VTVSAGARQEVKEGAAAFDPLAVLLGDVLAPPDCTTSGRGSHLAAVGHPLRGMTTDVGGAPHAAVSLNNPGPTNVDSTCGATAADWQTRDLPSDLDDVEC